MIKSLILPPVIDRDFASQSGVQEAQLVRFGRVGVRAAFVSFAKRGVIRS